MGTVCWCIQLIPQIIYNYRRKNCEGLPHMMMFLWALCGIPFSIYFFSTRANIAVQVQPCLFTVFCLITWAQALYYPPTSLDRKKILVWVSAFVLFAVGMNVGFIIYLRRLYDEGTKWPTLIFGIAASILLALGLIPPYFELAKRQGRVVGINFLFLFIDFMGAFLSVLSVVMGNMDIMGIVLYCICCALEFGIFLSHFIWCIRFKWFNKDFVDEQKTVETENLDEVVVESKEAVKLRLSIEKEGNLV